MTSSLKKVAIVLIAGLFLSGAIYFSGQLFWSIDLVTGLQRDALQRERGLPYQIDHAALAAELRKFAYEHRWFESAPSDNPTIFWSADPAIPPSLRILQPTSVALFDDRIMFERGGPLHHFGIVVFREDSASGESKNGSLAGERVAETGSAERLVRFGPSQAAGSLIEDER
jgi:hypothetical protein